MNNGRFAIVIETQILPTISLKLSNEALLVLEWDLKESQSGLRFQMIEYFNKMVARTQKMVRTSSFAYKTNSKEGM